MWDSPVQVGLESGEDKLGKGSQNSPGTSDARAAAKEEDSKAF